MSKVSISLFIVAALLISACNVATDTGSDSEVENGQVRDIEVIATQPTFSGQMVTDTRVGFEFNYPDGWTFVSPGDVTNSTAYAYTMQSFELGVGGEPLPEGETKIDLYINPSDANASLTNIENRIQQEDANSEILTIESIETTTLESGREVLVVRGTGMAGEFLSIYAIIRSIGYSFWR